MTEHLFVMAMQDVGDQQERYWTGNSWSMGGVLQDAYVFRGVGEMVTAVLNAARKYPGNWNQTVRVYEVEEAARPSAPPPPRSRISLGKLL